MHSCMHTCLCLNAKLNCAYCGIWILFLLDCGEDQAYSCDCCACAGCCDQGKWHSCTIFILLYALVFFQVECMIGVLCFSSIMLCLEHLVVYSYPEPQLGKCLAILGYYPNVAFSFWLWWFSSTLKINNLNESPGWNGCLVVDSWVATQDYVHLWWF